KDKRQGGMLSRSLIWLCWLFLSLPCQSQTTPSSSEAINIPVGAKNAERRIEPGGGLEEGQSFRDCPNCRELVVAPSGTFMMGAETGSSAPDRSRRQDQVIIPKAFAIGRFTVTFDEWHACLSGDGCDGYLPSHEKWGEGDRPVINVNWLDAKAYVEWLSQKTGKHYRLPSEAEWEYAAR